MNKTWMVIGCLDSMLMSEYMCIPMFPMNKSEDDYRRRVHLSNKVKAKRFQGTKWYSVIYK